MSRPPFSTTFDLPPTEVLGLDQVTPKPPMSTPGAPQPAPPDLSARLCAADRPLALFPVRLETRFSTAADGARELRVRIYPDKAHLDSHEPTLLVDEKVWGIHFWEQDWRAGDDMAARKAAWRQLADRFGAPRAAWVARTLQPTNAAQRPSRSVDGGQPLTPSPTFPDVATEPAGETSAWRHAPRARLMPKRWTLVLQASGRPVLATTGAPIADPLAVGPDPKTPPGTGDDQSAADEGTRWMVDFATAETEGMGLRVPLPAGVAPESVDSLVVFGTAEADAEAAAGTLANLFDAHHYTDGLEFLPLGAPTNNTADSRAAYGGPDPGHELSFAREIDVHLKSLDADTNALQAGTAFGLPPDRIAPVFGRLGQAGERHEADGRSVSAALWPTTWGYFLENHVGFDGTGLTPDTVDWVRRQFVSHVRAFGPLSAMRFGRQPYGVLPVTSLDLFQPSPEEAAEAARLGSLRDLLAKLRDQVWRPQLGRVPRLGARTAPPDPDADLADVMQTDGVSAGLRTRAMLGRHYLQHLRAFIDEDLQARGFFTAQDEIAGALPVLLGLPAATRLGQASFADLSWPVTLPLVQDGPIARNVALAPDYIGALLSATSIEAVVAQRPDPTAAGASATLLQTLLRHGLLREIAGAAARLAATRPGADLAALLRDTELIDLVDGAAPTLTFTRQLGLTAPATGQQTIRAFLEAQSGFDTPPLAGLGEYRRALAHLQGLDVERLRFLLQGGLDLAANRLDAWITALATRRLGALRAEAPQGVYVGAYGWVENLHPGPTPEPAPQPPPGQAGPVFLAPGDSGFLHAPSLTHASAAALLRNAHLGADAAPKADSPFAIRLSSRRVRESEQLLAGMRQGQPLGALLGYRLERSLHELGLDASIAPLRELAPLTAGRLTPMDQPLEAIAADNVVDGLVLQAKWRDQPQAVRARLQAAGSAVDTVARELDRLGETIDGLGDSLLAEAAYQMARGNPMRLASSLATLSHGDAAPPELEVAHIPRNGVALTHRVLVLAATEPSPPDGWAGPDASPRAAAEPALSAWAAGLLGDPRKIRCSMQSKAADGTVTTPTLPLSELGLSPLDVVFGVNAEPAAGSASSEVEQRVLYTARRALGGPGAGAVLSLLDDRPADLAADEITLFDALEQARATQRLLTRARAADPEDLCAPQRAEAGSADLAELEQRVAAAEAALSAAQTALASAAAADRPADTMRSLLLELAGFGVGPAIPASALGDDAPARAALARQAAALAKTAQARLDRGAALRAASPAADARARAKQLRGRMAAVFGTDLPALARLSCDAAMATELASALADAPAALGDEPAAPEGWLLRAARVREPLARFGACLRGAEALGAGERLRLHVAQLPFAAGERWVGLPPLDGQPLAAGKLSLVLQSTESALDFTQPVTGFWVDEWVEVAPSTTETTALTFPFDPPDAVAPQAILLAVPPQLGQDWTAATLLRVLTETLDLAKLRGVDLAALQDAGQYLPAAYLAFNVRDDVVSSDLRPLTQ